MHGGAWALRLSVVLLVFAEAASAQQEPKPKDLPEAPVPKQESPAQKQKRDNPLRATVGILGRRSIFFPDLAASTGPLSTKQKFELFADKSIAPSRFLVSGAGAGLR